MDSRWLIGILLSCGLGIASPRSSHAIEDPQTWDSPQKYREANEAYDRGDWETAVRLWTEVLERTSDNPPAHDIPLFLGEALVQLGRSAEAADRFQTFLDQHPDDPRAAHAQFRLGEAAYLTGQLDRAQPRLETYLTRETQGLFRPYANAYLAEIALAQSRWQDAMRHFQAALASAPDESLADRYRFGMAQAAEGDGRLDDADRFYATVAGRPTTDLVDDALLQAAILRWRRSDVAGAQELLERLTEPAGGFVLATRGHYLLGRLHDQAGDRAAAIAAFAASEATAGDDREAELAARFERSRLLQADGQHPQAIVLWQALLEDPGSAPLGDDAAFLWVQHCFDLKQWEELEAIAASCEKLHPQGDCLPQVLEYRGRAALETDRFVAAAQHFERLLTLTATTAADEPQQRSRRYLAGLAMVRAGRHEQGLAILEPLAGKLADPASEAGRSLAVLEANQQLGRPEQVVAIATEHLAMFPDSLEAAAVRSQLCEALTESGQWAQADQAWLTYAQLHPDHEALNETLQRMARIATEANETTWSRRWLDRTFERLESTQPTPQALLQAAQAQRQAGDTQRATEWLERLLDRFPDAPEAATAALLLAQDAQLRQDLAQAEQRYREVIERFAGTDSAAAAELALAILWLRGDVAEQQLKGRQQLTELAKTTRSPADAALYELARFSLETGELVAANTAWEQLVRQFPRSDYRADALFRLAEVSLKKRDLHAAETWLKTLETDHPDSKLREAGELMAIRVAMAAEHWSDVVTRADRFLDSYDPGPRTATARFWRAESLRRLGRLDEAAREFQALVAESDDSSESWWPWVSIQLARIAIERQAWADGLAWCAKASQQDPEGRRQLEIDPLLGRCLLETGDFSGARVAFERCARQPAADNENLVAESLWWIGESWRRQRDFKAAIDAYLRVSTLFANSSWHREALLSSAKAEEESGNVRQAMLTYARLLREFPDSTQSVEASRRLTSLRLSVDTETQKRGAETSTDRTTRTASPPAMPPVTGERAARTEPSTVPRRER